MTQPNDDSIPQNTRIVSVVFWMLGALASFAMMGISGRELSSELSTVGILFYRSAIGLVIVVSLLAIYGWQHIRTEQVGRHIMRNLAHYGGQFGWFYGIGLMPLAQVFAIEFTVPIWTVLLAVVFLRERLTKFRVFALVCGLTGVLVALRPGYENVPPAALIVLGAAFCYALAYVATRKLVVRDSPLTIVFYMTVVQLPIGFVAFYSEWMTPSPAMWPWLLLVASSALSAHYCISKALKLADAAIVLPIDFLRLPLIAVIGAVFYNERVDLLLMVGAAIMVFGNVVNLVAEKRQNASR